MLGWEKLSSMCGLGCRVLFNPWGQEEKLSYNKVLKDETDGMEEMDTITNQPPKPVWTDMASSAPIVRNKSGSMGNIRNTAPEGKALVANSAKPARTSQIKKEDKQLSGSQSSLSKSTETLHVAQLVTTV